METLFYVDNQTPIYIDLSELSILSPSDTFEGTTYQWNDKALKIFYPNRWELERTYPILEEEGYQVLTKQKREYYLFPEHLLYNGNHQFAGYMMKLIQNVKIPYCIQNMPIESFLKQANSLYEETKLNTDAFIRINDVFHNYIYNGTIFICDPGFYTVFSSLSDDSVKKNIEEFNLSELNLLLTRITFFYETLINDPFEIVAKAQCSLFLDHHIDDSFYGDYMRDVCQRKGYENIGEYAQGEKEKILIK